MIIMIDTFPLLFLSSCNKFHINKFNKKTGVSKKSEINVEIHYSNQIVFPAKYNKQL